MKPETKFMAAERLTRLAGTLNNNRAYPSGRLP
jgi:hypothetical protein